MGIFIPILFVLIVVGCILYEIKLQADREADVDKAKNRVKDAEKAIEADKINQEAEVLEASLKNKETDSE